MAAFFLVEMSSIQRFGALCFWARYSVDSTLNESGIQSAICGIIVTVVIDPKYK